MNLFSTKKHNLLSDKTNYKFDFENQNLNIPLDEKLMSWRFIDYKQYVITYIAVAAAQIFDSGTTTFRYQKGEFYFDVYLEQPSIGLLFIRDRAGFSAEKLEKLRVFCSVYKIKLALVYLYSGSQSDEVFVTKENTVILNISGNENIEELDNKIKMIMKELLRIHLRKLYVYRDELYDKMDKDLCKKLAVLFSLKMKNKSATSFFEAYSNRDSEF